MDNQSDHVYKICMKDAHVISLLKSYTVIWSLWPGCFHSTVEVSTSLLLMAIICPFMHSEFICSWFLSRVPYWWGVFISMSSAGSYRDVLTNTMSEEWRDENRKEVNNSGFWSTFGYVIYISYSITLLNDRVYNIL